MTNPNRRAILLFVLLPALVVLAGSLLWIRVTDDDVARTAGSPSDPGDSQSWAAIREELRTATVQEALSLAYRLRSEEPAINSTLTAEHVEFTFPDGRKVGVPIGRSEMIVSIAPYRLKTHPCTIHSISGCQGELTERTFDVAVYDTDGEVVFSGPITTGESGFFELPLPRGSEFRVTVESNLGRAERIISTSSADPTCITDMKLL